MDKDLFTAETNDVLKRVCHHTGCLSSAHIQHAKQQRPQTGVTVTTKLHKCNIAACILPTENMIQTKRAVRVSSLTLNPKYWQVMKLAAYHYSRLTWMPGKHMNRLNHCPQPTQPTRQSRFKICEYAATLVVQWLPQQSDTSACLIKSIHPHTNRDNKMLKVLSVSEAQMSLAAAHASV